MVNHSFTAAALDRIAQCVARPTSATSANDVLHQLVENAASGKVGHWANVVQDYQEAKSYLTQTSPEFSSMQVLTIAGLIELGVIAGYVNLEEWGPIPTQRLYEILMKFKNTALAHQNESVSPANLNLFDDLLSRFPNERLFEYVFLEQDNFYVFESYLALSDSIWRDDAFLQFLVKTYNMDPPEYDLMFLVSPRHFAAALATGIVGIRQVTRRPWTVGLHLWRSGMRLENQY